MTEAEYNNIVLTKQLVREVLRTDKPEDKKASKVEWLARLGGDVNAKIYGKSLLTHAIEKNEDKIVDVLRKKEGKEWVISEKEANDLGKLLIKEVVKGDLEKISGLIEDGARVDVCDEDKWTALLVASAKGFGEIVDKLLEHGANIDEKNGDKKTALQAGCMGGHVEVVRLLIQKGAKINVKTKNEETALMFAVDKGNIKIVKMLIENGADVNLQDSYGETALMKAIKKDENYEIVRLLLDKDADVNAKKNDGQTALMRACFLGDKVVVNELLCYGAEVGIKDNSGETVLDKMKFFYGDDKIKIWKMLEDAREIEEKNRGKVKGGEKENLTKSFDENMFFSKAFLENGFVK